MGYRNYKSYRRKRSYSRSRNYQPDLAESFGAYLADVIGAFVRGIIRGIGRIFHPAAKPPASSPIPSPHKPTPLPLRQSPLRTVLVDYRNLPYQKTSALVTPGEHGIWYSLERAVQGKYRLFCKVRLADIVCCPHENSNEGYWFRKIGRYHVDFVICDLTTTAPLLVVELDDRRHREHLRKMQDEFKDAVLRAAGVPVCRIVAQAAYDVEELRLRIAQLVTEPV
jgi:hypothetical protein